MYRQIYVEKSKAPLLLNSCEHDPMFPKELAETTDEKFTKFEPGYKRTYWEGVPHGFATRGDLVCFRVLVLGHIDTHSTSCAQTNPVVTAAKEGAFKAIVEWFINYMQ